VFHRYRWAGVFVNILDGNAEEGLGLLRVLVKPVKTIPGALFGYAAASRLEKILLESSGGFAGDTQVYAHVIRFIVLLVQKNCFIHIDIIMQKIEELVDEQKGILAVTVESAVPINGDSEQELRQKIMERTGAKAVKMKLQIVPDLLGGYRLLIGGFYIDASLKGQIEIMQSALGGGI
jgi:F-type H+-transporting ATPase subunit delta